MVAVNPTQAGNPSFVGSEKDLPIGLTFDGSVFKWTLKYANHLDGVMIHSQLTHILTASSTAIKVNWENPTLLQVLNGNTSASSFPVQNNVIELKQANQWVYFVIDSPIPVAHPIHLHGHDFSILAQGSGTFTPGTTPINLVNPPRRDVALMPGGGYLVMGWLTDNPGNWLMHCHIVSEFGPA